MQTKICTRCNVEKSIEDFHKNKSKKDGTNNWCKTCSQSYNKQYQELNKEKILLQHKEYNKINKKTLAIKKKIYYQKYYKEKRREYIRNWTKNKRDTNLSFKLISARRSRRYSVLKNNKLNKSLQDLGCTIQFWKEYLEQRFDENMTWNNYGKYWHIDEIIPCTAWDILNPLEQKACFHYMNSQPLEKTINLSKSGANRKDYTKEKQQFLMVLRALGEI